MVGSRHKVARPGIRTTVLDVQQIDRHNGSVALEPELRARLNTWTRPTEVVFFLPRHTKLDWLAGFLRKQRRNASLDRSRDLATKPTTTILSNNHKVFRIHTNPTRHATFSPRCTLRGTVHVAFSVLPVSHRGSRFKRLVRKGRRKDRLIQHQIRVSKTGLDITDLPLIGYFAPERHNTILKFVPVDVVPLNRLKVSPGHRVPIQTSIGTTWTKTIHRIECERQWLEIDLNRLDCLRGCFFINSCDGQNRVAFIKRLIR